MADQVVEVTRRDDPGKNESRRLRKLGQIPAVLYGEAKEPVKVKVDARVIDKILHSRGGMNTIFDLAMQGTDQKRSVMIKAYQLNPITDRLMHADFLRISADREVQVSVAIEVVGIAIGIKADGGLLEFSSREIKVACLPKDIPASIQVDVTELRVGQAIHVAQLQLPPGIRLLSDPHTVICAVHSPQAEAVVAPTAVPGAEAVAGAPAAAAAAAPAADDKKKEDAGKKADSGKKKEDAPKKK